MQNRLAVCTVATALLAGCSGTSQGGALPPSAPLFSRASSVAPYVPAGKITPSKLLELQAEGKLPAPVPAKTLQWELKHEHGRTQPLVAGTKCVTAAWVTAPYAGYLVGLDRTLTNVCKTFNIDKLGSNDPFGVKVDASRNVWVADEYNNNATGATVDKFAPHGNLQTTYVWSHCLSGYTSCYGEGWDVAANTKNVFASVADWNSTSASSQDYGTGVEVFANGDPSGTPTYIAVSDHENGSYCAPICDLSFLDVDGSGNIWFDFNGNGAGSCSGGGLGEIANPTTSPVVSVILPACTYGYPGGVYVSNHGKVLNVTDQDTRNTYQYHLPVTASSTPFRTLGPTLQNAEGIGEPVSGSFNANDTELLLADGYGWFDLDTVSTNKWTDIASLNCPSFISYGCAGAAFTPSDK